MAKRARALQALDPIAAARIAGLRYVDDTRAGIARRRSGAGFRYLHHDGRPVRDKETLGRIKGLVIPPAWQDVWICAEVDGHIQATGRDARGRKQYRYHPRWREVRDATKYTKMIAFGEVLPAIRKTVTADLARAGLPREKVIATVVRLLDATLIRVGNEEYARENQSYGLSTMLGEHVDVTGHRLRFTFRGKSGKDHDIEVHDRRVARIVEKMSELPGHELFKFVDADGVHHAIESADVNTYLKGIAGEEHTAKDFRTWAGTVLAASVLAACPPSETKTAAARELVAAVKSVAAKLGNTPAVCRRCYIHPGVIGAFEAGELGRIGEVEPPPHEGLSRSERAVLALLRRQLTP